jgi:hypothetical protein
MLGREELRIHLLTGVGRFFPVFCNFAIMLNG